MNTVADNIYSWGSGMSSQQSIVTDGSRVEKRSRRVNKGTPVININFDTRTTSEQNPYKIIDVAHIVLNRGTHFDSTIKPKDKARLSISMAPGKKDNRWNRNLDIDLETIKNNGIDVIVCLLEWSEMCTLSLGDYPRKVQEKGLLFYHLPIKDGGVTSQKELNTLVPILVQHLFSGKNVLVHCRAGLGRAGTICGCCFGHFGYQGRTGIDTVRIQRPGAIQTTKQEECVIEYCRSLIIG